MNKPAYLLIALLLMTAGWSGSFLLGGTLGGAQNYWLIPAVAIGAGIGLCLRQVNGPRTALMLVASAVFGLGVINLFFPESHVSLGSLRTLLRGSAFQVRPLQLRVDEDLKLPPFDQPFKLVSPVELEVALLARMPAAIEDICFAPDATLYASLPALGAVYRLRTDATGALENELFFHGLDNPTGLACAKERLLVAEGSRLSTLDYRSGQKTILATGFPDDGGSLNHRLLVDGEHIYLTIDARCDACSEKNPLRATVQQLDQHGEMRTFARGLRQVGGLALDPQGGNLWASERSRLYPAPAAADELNRVAFDKDYGWPHCEENIDSADCDGKTGATLVLRHSANPAELVLTRDLQFPAVYRDSMLLVLQGDADIRVVPALARLPLREGEPQEPVPFLAGWDGVKTRPASLAIGPDGALYIGDDISGAIYRVAWRGGD